MKLQTREIDKFLAAPPAAIRVFLFYGPDQGLVQVRARAMIAKFANDLNDPFAVSLLDGDDVAKDPSRLIAESAMLALGADQRVLWLRSADDKCGKAVEALLLADDIPAVVIIEAEELGPKSVMRKLAEAANNAAAIPCYVEDAGQVSQYVTRELAASGFQLSRDAATWFGQNLGGDRGMVEQELQKLITYLGQPNAQNKNVDLETLQEIAAGGGQLAEDAFVDAIGTPRASFMLEKLLQEGSAPVSLIRMIGRHVQKLYQVQLRIQSGEDMKSAMDQMQPKLFFKREAAFRAQLARFSLRTLSRLRTRLLELEKECKQTGAPDEVLLSQLVLALGASRA